MDVYKASAFEDRVNYAASCIVRGYTQGRHFDTCFEMSDGDYVAAALVRRTLKNPESKLAGKLFKVVSRERAMQSYEETKQLTRKQLREKAVAVAVAGCAKIGYTNL
jgi:DNA-binding phage protein